MGTLPLIDYKGTKKLSKKEIKIFLKFFLNYFAEFKKDCTFAIPFQ